MQYLRKRKISKSEEQLKKDRARGSVVNLVIALAFCMLAVAAIVSTLPRDESNRINEVDYHAVVTQAHKDNAQVLQILPVDGWWCNLAGWNPSPEDSVATFKAGFVGSDTKYIGYTQALNTNPTWLAFALKDVTITGEYVTDGVKWEIYQSKVKHDPAKTMDTIWVLNYNKNTVLLYGVAEQSELETYAIKLTDGALGRVIID